MRIRSQPPRSPHPAQTALVAATLALLAAGCSLESPKAPQFDTTVNLPLGTRATTGRDLLSDSEYIEGDSTGASPLAFVLRGEMDPVEVGRFLDLETPTGRFRGVLGEVELDPPLPESVVFALRSLSPEFGSLPSEPIVMTVDPFTIARQTASIPPIEGLVWARLSGGRVGVTVQNELPVPLGAADGSAALAVRITNRQGGSLVFAGEMPGTIPPGGRRTLTGNLAGREITNDLACEIRGGSPGSDLVPVEIRADEQGIILIASLLGLTADSARAEVPAQVTVLADSVALSDDVRLIEGEVRAGTIPLTVENGLPVAADAELILPTVRAANQLPLIVDLRLPPAVGGRPGRAVVDLDLAGTTIRATNGRALRALPWRMQLTTEPSEGLINLGARQGAGAEFGRGSLAFDRITGTMNQRRFQLVPTETTIDPPEGIDELEFMRASLELAIESSVGMGSEAELTLTAIPDGGGAPVVLPLRFAIDPPAGPGRTRTTLVTLDETNSAILSLIVARPRRLRIEGALRIGVDGVSATVRRTDAVRGAYTLSAPLRMRIGQISHRTEPFRLTLDAEAQGRIRENVLSAEAVGVVRNHFPAGMTARLVFGVTKRSLDLDPAANPDSVIALDPITVTPGVVGASGGRVIETAESPVAIVLDPAEVQFFARDELFGRIALTVNGDSADRVVEMTAADFVEVNAMLRFDVRVKR